MTASAKLTNITRQAMPPEIVFDNRRPTDALIKKPMNGKRGISDSTRSPLQRRKGFRIKRLAVTEESNHQREADSGFRGGNRHHKERDDLPIDSAELPAKGDKREICRIQHDLDRQQQGDQVAAKEYAG